MILYKSIKRLTLKGRSSGYVVSIYGRRIRVKFISFADAPIVKYYRQYPPLPTGWDAIIDEYGTVAAEDWILKLHCYKPYKIVTPRSE